MATLDQLSILRLSNQTYQIHAPLHSPPLLREPEFPTSVPLALPALSRDLQLGSTVGIPPYTFEGAQPTSYQ